MQATTRFLVFTSGRPIPETAGSRQRLKARKGTTRLRTWSGKMAGSHLSFRISSIASGATAEIPKKTGKATVAIVRAAFNA
jgi:hypothetical protein